MMACPARVGASIGRDLKPVHVFHENIGKILSQTPALISYRK